MLLFLHNNHILISGNQISNGKFLEIQKIFRNIKLRQPLATSHADAEKQNK